MLPSINSKPYLSIVSHYEQCLEKHGDTHLGVDWPKKEDVSKRYEVMLEVIKDKASELTLLDFGCGASHLYEYLTVHGFTHVRYAGLDISHPFVQLSQNKFPQNDYYCVDILDTSLTLPSFDYIVMNGVFTERKDLSFEQMLSYFKQVLKAVFAITNIGIAFNVMSKQVDWEREDLFHLPLDTLAGFLTREITRDFVIRNDYGLYEYTTYVYR